MNILTVKSAYYFIDEKPIIKNIDFCLDQFSRLAVIGPNGAGKTTLLMLLSKIIVPARGEIKWEKPNKIRFLPSPPGLYPDLTGIENIQFFSCLNGLSVDKKDIIDNAQDIDLGEELTFRRVASYSSGEKQKVQLLVGLFSQPDILILDEPTANMDDTAKDKVINFIIKSCENITIIFATHDNKFVEKIGTHKLVLNNGIQCEYKENK